MLQACCLVCMFTFHQSSVYIHAQLVFCLHFARIRMVDTCLKFLIFSCVKWHNVVLCKMTQCVLFWSFYFNLTGNVDMVGVERIIILSNESFIWIWSISLPLSQYWKCFLVVKCSLLLKQWKFPLTYKTIMVFKIWCYVYTYPIFNLVYQSIWMDVKIPS